jgi:hypothetical protein
MCQPDSALKELQAELQAFFNVEALLQTIMHILKRAGFTRKSVHGILYGGLLGNPIVPQVTCSALEQNEQDCAEFQALIRTHFHPEQLVFANKSHFNWLTLRRLLAWSIQGEHATCYEYFLRGTKYSLLPAISLDGILHLEVLENVVTGDMF